MRGHFTPWLVVAAMIAGPVAGQSRTVVLSEPGTPVVAAEIIVGVGIGAGDEADRPGLAYLAARSLIRPIRPTLDSLGVRLTLVPQKDALSFGIVSAPDVWEEATRVLASALYEAEPDSAAMIRERAEIAAELRGRLANPADAATRVMDVAFFGEDHPWGSPIVGTPESIERATFREVDDYLRENIVQERSVAAAVGPLDMNIGLGHLNALLGSGERRRISTPEFDPEESPIRREYDSVTTWVGVSYLFPESADAEAMRFIGFLAADDLSFSPLQRSVYDVESEVVTRVGGGEIPLQLVVPPEEAELWEERAGSVVERLFDTPILGDVFLSQRRRFVGLRRMALASPEERAHEAARQLLLGGIVSLDVSDPEELTQERVSGAARSLGDPTVVLLGPNLDN